jgi:hypothetical protein
MRNVLFGLIVCLSLTGAASAQHAHSSGNSVAHNYTVNGYPVWGYGGYYTGYGFQPGLSYYPNGFYRVNGPSGGYWINEANLRLGGGVHIQNNYNYNYGYQWFRR